MKIEEIRALDAEGVQTRFAEIAEEIKQEGADFKALNIELDALEARKAELRAQAEAKKAAALRVAGGAGAVIETKKETAPVEERTYAVDTVEYREAYLKNLMGKPVTVEERAAVTKASAVIPTQMLNTIIGKLKENPLIAELEMLHIPGYVSVPVATTVNDASWIAMGTASTDSADVIDTITLGIKKLIKTIEITADMSAMSIEAFETWLVAKLTEKMETAICAAVLTGAGNATAPQGIITKISKTTMAGLTLKDITKLMSGLGSAYHATAVWVMSSAMWYTNILPLANDRNGVVVNDGIAQRLISHKVILDDNAGNNLVFGSLKKGYLFNMGDDVKVEADTSLGFRSGSTVFRAMALGDGAVADTEAFVVGGTA